MSQEAWRTVWRAAAPLLPTRGLEALRQALLDDDPRLVQGSTTIPPPLMCVQDWPCEAGCLLAYPIAFENGTADGQASTLTVASVEEAFARVCFDVDESLGEPAGVRYLLNWYDEAPREEMRRNLLPEVEAELARRNSVDTPFMVGL